MYDQIKQDVIALADILGEKLVEIGPQAREVALGVARMEGLSSLLPALPMAILAIFGWYLGGKIYVWANDDSDGEFIGIMVKFFSIPLLIMSVIWVFDTWAWVAVFNPELYIAHQVIESVVK
jgi:hypothetical protein